MSYVQTLKLKQRNYVPTKRSLMAFKNANSYLKDRGITVCYIDRIKLKLKIWSIKIEPILIFIESKIPI